MSFIRKHSRLAVVGVLCATVGAGASAIATAGASTPAATGGSAVKHSRLHRGMLARAVHGQAVVATKTGFQTVTFDRGFAQSVNRQQLTIRDGTRTRTYKTVTLTIPAGAVIRDNRNRATLSDVKPGQRVVVVQGPNRTWVIAHTARTP